MKDAKCTGPFTDARDCPLHNPQVSKDWAEAFFYAIKTIPLGNRLDLKINRYDTDDEQVLQLYGNGITYDIRTPKNLTSGTPGTPRHRL